ncbi:MAG: S8 family serine peptidase, partial [Candidatus Poseidoniales archaeon]
MKTHLIVAFMVSSLLFSFVNVDDYNSTNQISSEHEFSIEDKCGFSKFSESVRSSFFKASNLDSYDSPQIYLTKVWTVVLASPYCNYSFAELNYEFNTESYRSSSILNGTWSLTYQTGDLAYMDLSEAKESGFISIFYPLIEKQRDLKFEPNDDNYTSGEQWYLKNSGQNNGTSDIDLNTQGAWDNYNGDGVFIGVIDDGVDHQHPDLSPNYLSQNSFDYCGNDTNAAPTDSDGDEVIDWHGTAVSGIVAGKGNNSIGISGVAYDANIVGIRLIAEDCTLDYSSDEAEALALNHHLDLVDIYTNSWGPSDDGSTLGEVGPLALAALEKGISEGRDGLGSIYTWANGNGRGNLDQSNKDAYANSRYTIAVGALNWQGKQTSYSEAGSNLLVSAPSHNKYDWVDPAIFTTDISGAEGANSTDYMSSMGGTSAATPMVAGVVALMLEANPTLTWRDVQHILVKTSKKVDNSHPGWFETHQGYDYNHAYGYGLVDATAAVNMAESWETIGEELVVKTGEKRVDGNIFDDNDVGISSTITVNESINIESVEILVNVTHYYRGDLNFFLTSPNGVVSELVRAHGDPGLHYRNWTFTSVVHWDENSFGDWTLKINDTVGQGSGDFNTWNLTFYGSSAPDRDNDNLSDYAEDRIGSFLNFPDSDNDGILDGDEFYGWEDSLGNIHRTDLRNVDTDNDKLSDSEEGYNYTGFITDPNDNDTDDDGLLDGDEVLGTQYNNFYITNPLSVDTDNDTLGDFNEIFAYLFDLPGSDPTRVDSDSDTMPDPYELEKGFDPMQQIDGNFDSDYDGFDLNFDGFLEQSEYYTNAMEYAMGTDPQNSDSDSDGMHDGWEYYWGLDPLHDDSQDDFDNDTLTNIYEYDNMLVESKIFSLSEPSLRGFWKFDGIDQYTMLDMTINSNTAVAIGEPSRVLGKSYNGMYCNGETDYGRLSSISPSKMTEYTVQGWVNLTNFTDDFGTLVGTAKDGITWLGINSDNYFEFRVYSG